MATLHRVMYDALPLSIYTRWLRSVQALNGFGYKWTVPHCVLTPAEVLATLPWHLTTEGEDYWQTVHDSLIKTDDELMISLLSFNEDVLADNLANTPAIDDREQPLWLMELAHTRRLLEKLT
ncbi:MAG: hypothetical protein ACR2PH_17910 [Desulfobulbia bacterium]